MQRLLSRNIQRLLLQMAWEQLLKMPFIKIRNAGVLEYMMWKHQFVSCFA